MLTDLFTGEKKKELKKWKGIGEIWQAHSKGVSAQCVYGIMGGRGGVPPFLFGYFYPNSCCCCLCFPSHSHLIQLFALGGPWWMILPFQRCVWILSGIFSGSCSSALIFASSSTCLVSTIFFRHSLNARVLFSAKLQTFFPMILINDRGGRTLNISEPVEFKGDEVRLMNLTITWQ